MQLCSVVCMSVCLSGRLCVCSTQPCAVLKRIIEMHRFLMKLFSTSNTEIITYFAGNSLTLNCRMLFWLATLVNFWINCVTATTV